MLPSLRKSRPPTTLQLFISLIPQLLVALSVAALSFAAGRASSFLPTPPPPTHPGSDPCTWAPDFRPLPAQTFLDVQQLLFTHPQLPPGASVKVYATKRPGASYAPHREFWDTASSGEWEKTTFRVLREALTAGALASKNVYWDIGGWVGPTTLFAAHYVKRVLTLEPDPRAFEELYANAALNPGLASRIELFRHCLAGATGPVTMTGPAPLGSSMSRVGGAARIPAAPAAEQNWGERMASWPATCSAPAAFAARAGLAAGQLALVKVDVEGAEAAILPPLVAWLGEAGAPKPPIFVELHVEFWADAAGAAPRAVAEALSAYAFAYVSRAERPGHEARPNALLRYSPLELLEKEGAACPDKQTFCMVLVSDEEVAWAGHEA